MKQKDILLLIISSFFLVVFWIAFNIYHNIVTSTIPETLSVQIFPISPTFDKKTINAIKERIQITPIYNPLATQSAPPKATTSSIISTSSAVATEGGTLS
ncbi:MAG: hypothetical protein HYU48_02085, partial [Candidatus Levybacteria bacterium]|nr:hypothetical protein [Candidatus Levybacteria bacterium]